MKEFLKNIQNRLKAFFLWLWLPIAKRWLKVRLWYWVRWIRRASVKEKRIYHILLNPYTREVLVCNNNEYQNIKRNLRKKGTKSGQFLYATANPFG